MSGESDDKRRILPVLAGFMILVAMVGASLWLARSQARVSAETGRLFDYQAALLETLSAVKDAEIGQRGYLLTSNAVHLDQYRSGKPRAYKALALLPSRGDGSGARIAARLKPLIDAKFAEMAQTMALEGAGRDGEAVAVVRSDRGRSLMNSIRTIVTTEIERNRADLTGRRDAMERGAWALTVGLLIGLVLVMIVTAFWGRQSLRQIRSLRLARDEARAAAGALRRENEAREAAESQLRQMQKMESIGQLTGGIAHDFNNMLAIVIGNLDLAGRRMTSDPDRALKSIGHAREGAERAATLTSRLLAFSRQQPLQPEAVDANKLVSSMSEMLRRTLGEQLSVETVLAGGLWRTFADAGQLENAIVNLAVNARDAMPDGGKLTIETANAHLDDNYADSRAEVVPGQYVLICITDTGTGMTPEVIERAFDPFFTTKDVGKGTGLGLSQVFGFVKQSGGHVAIYSEPGDGTTIKMYMPRYLGVAEVAGHSEGTDDMPLGQTSEIILVVEDEQRVRHFSVDALRELGYTTLSASSPLEALRLIEDHPEISLLFTDIVMPDMDGRRLADAAREKRPGLKVVYTTGYTRNAVVHNGRLDADVNFLPKPYSVAQLARKIRGVLDES